MTPLVLIPGLMCDSRLFGPQIQVLEKSRKISVVVPKQNSIEQMASHVLGSVDGPISVAGLSMGGIVAMEMLRQARDRIQALALLDTTPLADAPENYAVRNRQIEDVRGGRLKDVMREELKPAYLVDGPAKQELLELCTDMAELLGPSVFEFQATALRDRSELTNVLKTAPERTLILYGAEDVLCPPQRHLLMHKHIPWANLVEISNAGHLPTLEQPKATTDALQGWLS